MPRPARVLASAVAAALLAATPVAAAEFDSQLRALAETELALITHEPAVLDALRAQNGRTAGLTQFDIDALDRRWRDQVGAADRPMIDEVLNSPASAWLRAFQDQEGGLVTEVFVTDARGLNVAQSEVTSDYWQGDEDKWSVPFGKPEGTLHFGEIELDESTQTYQSQVSMPINDPDSGKPLGALTVGVNVEMLQ